MPSRPLPLAVDRALGRLDRRLRAASALRGLGLTALLVVLGAVLGMAVDVVWVLPAAVRWIIWLGWLALAAAMLTFRVVGPLARRADPLELAAVAERADERLGERLTAAVGLLGGPRRANGSPALVAAVVDDASARAGAIDTARAVSLRGGARWLMFGIAAMVLATAPSVVRPDPFATLARRFVAPWADLERVGRFVVSVAPGDAVAALGADLPVSARVRVRFGGVPAPDDAWLEWTEQGGAPRRVAMVPGTDARTATDRDFSVTLPRLAGSLTYRVVSGSAASRSFRIKGVEPPALAAVSVRVEPPAYTRLPAASVRDSARIEAWEGSRVVLDVTTRTPVRSVEVGWPQVPKPVAARLAADRKTASTAMTAEASGPYVVSLRDEHGLANRPEPPRRLVVRLDAPPVVAIRGPESPAESSPDDTLSVAIAARDDVAVAAVELHYAVERAASSSGSEPEPQTGHVAATVKGLATATARGAATLALGPLGLKPGDRLAYRVRVVDNRPAPRGPNVVWAEGGSLAIVSGAESMLARRSRAERALLQAKLDVLKKSAAENRKETEQLRYAADAVQRGNGRWDRDRQEALTQREAEARSVADRLQLLARELADDARFQPLARPARQIAEVEAESGRAMLEQARGQSDPIKRFVDLRHADARLAAVSNRLDELQRRFDALARGDADSQRLRTLASREETLARSAAEKAADRAQLDRLQAEQAAAQKDLEALLKESPALRADVLRAQADEAEALARRARDLAERQRTEARRATDVSRQAEALAALAEAQRALEDDARRLALEVDEPLSENGRGRLNTEPLRQAVEPIERGDLEQGRQRLEGAEAELRRLARDLEDVPGDPRALAQRLARRQEALSNRVAETIREAGGDRNDLPKSDAEALARKLGPMADRQAEIARLAATIQPARESNSELARRFPQGAAQNAVRNAGRAAEALRTSKPGEIQARQHEARRDLQHLANSLPDVWRRQEPARHKLDEARRQFDEVARELERHLRETSPKPGRLPDPIREADDLANRLGGVAEKQARLAESLKKLEAELESEPRVEPQRDRAARRARELAETIQAVADKGAPLARRQELRAELTGVQINARAAIDRLQQKLHGQLPADDLAAELASDQAELRDRPPPRAPADRAAAAADQRRIATALRGLNAVDATRPQAEAVRNAEQAARALADPEQQDPRAAVGQAARAARALAEQLAAGVEGRRVQEAHPTPADPELGISRSQAEAAGQLARRERRLRERLNTILGERVEPQQALRDEATALARELADLRDRAQPLSNRSHGPAHEAAQLLGEHAPRAMDQGSEQLAQGRPAAARDAQRRAAELVERGAQQAEDLAAALRADRAGDAQQPQPSPSAPGPLAAAREAMRQAARQLDQARDPSDQGRQAGRDAQAAMTRAARDLRAAAQHAAERQGQGKGEGSEPGADADAELAGQGNPAAGNPRGRNLDPNGKGTGPGTPDLAEVQALVRSKTGRAWGELPGHLRTEILNASQGRYRDDYARLIQLYFQEIAAGGDRDRTRP